MDADDAYRRHEIVRRLLLGDLEANLRACAHEKVAPSPAVALLRMLNKEVDAAFDVIERVLEDLLDIVDVRIIRALQLADVDHVAKAADGEQLVGRRRSSILRCRVHRLCLLGLEAAAACKVEDGGGRGGGEGALRRRRTWTGVCEKERYAVGHGRRKFGRRRRGALPARPKPSSKNVEPNGKMPSSADAALLDKAERKAALLPDGSVDEDFVRARVVWEMALKNAGQPFVHDDALV